MGRIIAVASGKGGAGKTTVTAGLSSCLAAMGYKTLALDADAGLRNLDIVLGVPDKSVFDLYDLLFGRVSLSKAVVTHPAISNLFVLAAPAVRHETEPDEASMAALCALLRETYDVVLIDCPAGLGSSFRLAVAGADEAIVVSTPDLVSLRDAARTAQLLREMETENIRLIVNRVRPSLIKRRGGRNIDDAMDITGLPLLGILPEDENVIFCANNALPLILESQKKAALALLNVARRIRGEKIPLMHI